MNTVLWGRNTLQAIALGIFSISPAMADYHNFSISINPVGTYESGIFDGSASEISAYDKSSKRLFVTNAKNNTLDVLNISEPSNPQLDFVIDLSPYGGGPNSVSIKDRGIIAVAVQNEDKQAPGSVVFFNNDGTYLNQLTVGALPDMLTFSPSGNWLLVANEGEPNDDYTVDPEGSISIIPTYGNKRRIRNLTDADVRTADFKNFNFGNIDPEIRIFGPNATVAQDLEPEYITIPKWSRYAYVTLQENNAIAEIDIFKAKVTKLYALGTQDHNVVQLDASDRDDGINIQAWPVKGFYQPDAISSYRSFGYTFLVTANEGDARDYAGYSEEERVKDLVLDPTAFPDAAYLQEDKNLGRLRVTSANGDIDNDGDFDELYSYGSRSFSIWTRNGQLIYDSKSDLENITADLIPENFNSTNDKNSSFDNRSDDKGPEPEAVTIGRIKNRTFVFVGLERVGGIMVYDITNPFRVKFIQYLNNRDFNGNAALGAAGDLGPEGIVFIKQYESPTRKPLLAVTNEVSGSTTLYEINVNNSYETNENN